MFTRRVILRVLGAAALLFAATPVAAQEVIVTGPPPELRKNLDAFMKAFNSGSADQFETMAAAAFTPEYLKRQTAADRKAAFAKMVKEFGTIVIERVERNGPEAPLEAFVKGSVASGVFWIELDESSRFAGIRAEVVKLVPSATDAYRRH
jgi:hypothetical protein